MNPLAATLPLSRAGRFAAAIVTPGPDDASAAASRLPHCHRVNDLHSALNPTVVLRTMRPRNLFQIATCVEQARRLGVPVAVCGGRHAMGGQQFAQAGWLIDLSDCNRVLAFDAAKGLIEVEAGIRWPQLLAALDRLQPEASDAADAAWTFRQKQTGADQLSIGGALSANIHGRGLDFAPMVSDIEAFTIVTADGCLRRANRSEQPELFRLAIGGYGLFGVIASVTLRLVRRQRLQRAVSLIDVEDLMPVFDQRRAEGYTYGDWQFAIDSTGPDFLRRGVFSCYRPVPGLASEAASGAMEPARLELSEADWTRLLLLAHTDKARAFDEYARFYLASSGQHYDSDRHQMSRYVDHYHRAIDKAFGGRGSEMITELYVPRARLPDFMRACAYELRAAGANLIYGTVRLIRRDRETFLAWAREDYACVIFNLHVEHTPAGVAHAAEVFRRLIDRAAERSGSYYLAYHRFATRAQIETCDPRMRAFLALKAAGDPQQLFHSDWYRHCRSLFDAGDRPAACNAV